MVWKELLKEIGFKNWEKNCVKWLILKIFIFFSLYRHFSRLYVWMVEGKEEKTITKGRGNKKKGIRRKNKDFSYFFPTKNNQIFIFSLNKKGLKNLKMT